MAGDNWEDAFDCLRARERRVVLLALRQQTSRPLLLAGEGAQSGQAAQSDATDELRLDDVDAELDGLRMHHVHLPKLADAGYIEYSEGGARVSRGDSFEDIEPLLDVLSENEGSLPGIAG